MINQIVIRALMRRANQEGDTAAAIAWLEGIITSQFTVATGGKVLTGSTIDGQNFQWTIPGGMSPFELIAAAETALGHIENGTKPGSRVQAYF